MAAGQSKTPTADRSVGWGLGIVAKPPIPSFEHGGQGFMVPSASRVGLAGPKPRSERRFRGFGFGFVFYPRVITSWVEGLRLRPLPISIHSRLPSLIFLCTISPLAFLSCSCPNPRTWSRPTMPPRRTHTKSRSGCSNCKRRKVKVRDCLLRL